MKGYFSSSYRVKKNKGFSLIEMLVTAVIVGIVVAITAPSLSGLYSRQQVNRSVSNINGAIKEAQRQAIRRGQICEVKIDNATKTIFGDPSECLLEERDIYSKINVRATSSLGNPPTITFSAKGNTTDSGTIVFTSETTDTQKCFVIAIGLGIARTGKYIGATTGSVSAADCKDESYDG